MIIEIAVQGGFGGITAGRLHKTIDLAHQPEQMRQDLAEAFEALGWDVTDKRRKPLRLLPHYALPLALAIRGVAGELPFVAEPDHPTTDWGAGLAAEAARFRKR